MTPLTFITDERHRRRYIQINLAKVAEINDEQLEDLTDIIIAEARKDDEKIALEGLESQLKAESLL